MEIDLYQPCPCHAEKKIKFCCGKDVTAGLKEVLTLHESRQTAAALDQLKRLIDQHGPTDCLLLARSQLELNLGDPAAAEVTVRAFLGKNPGHAAGHERLATTLALQRRAAEAWSSLQDAMDHLTGSQIPVTFANGFRAVGWALAADGLVIAARGHAQMACFLDGSKTHDDRLSVTVDGMARNNPLLARSFDLLPLPEGAPESAWSKKYGNAVRATARRQYRKAAALIARALEAAPGEPRLLMAAALVSASFADPAATTTAFERLAACERLTMAERVEAMALAQLHDRPSEGPTHDVVEFEWPVLDFERLRERMDAGSHLAPVDLSQAADQFDEDSPPPRGAWTLLDRPPLKADQVAAASHTDIPVVVGRLYLFGRETDREPRLTTLVVRDNRSETALAWLRKELDELVGDPREEVSGNTPVETAATTVSWHLPPGTSRADYERLTRDRQFFVAREVIPDVRFASLGQRTLREAAADPGWRLAAQALVTSLEFGNDARAWGEEWGVAAREAAGLPPIPSPRMEDLQQDNQTAGLLARFVAPESLSSAHLAGLVQLASARQDFRVLRRLAPILLSRNDLGESAEERAALEMRLHLILSDVTNDDHQAFEHLGQARVAARKCGAPVGLVLVREFEQSLLRERFDRLQPLLRELELHHLRDDRVAQELGRVLVNYGLITADGQVMLPAAGPSAAEPASKVWTPETAEPAGTKSSSGLWLPGQ